MFGGAELIWGLISLFVFVGFVVLIAMLLAALVRPSRHEDRRPVRETLDQLYARGEITREEYLERKQVLGLEP